jgi:4-amino-4-deoxy-L-arabinose transferase-like glycosyltransferase
MDERQTEPRTDIRNPSPSRPWDRSDYALACILALLGCFFLWSGLSTRSLWGPEGRWAVIVREMVASGNYFLPTVNGVVDVDKPLFSYWAILPFVWLGGFGEAMLRIPSTLAGIGTILIVFAMGRRLFDRKTGFVAALLLLGSTMFLLWSRTASAESINTFAIWTILWAFLSYTASGRFRTLLVVYCAAALGSFFKGPVAAVAGFVVIFVYSVITSVMRLKESPSGRTRLAVFLSEFRWIASGKGAGAALSGLGLFALLLFAPVILTGSWDSAALMWKENVTRFVKPFDHTDPPTVYFKYVLLICAPWSFLMIASLWEMRRWGGNASRRFLVAAGLGIFCFFEFSGSRRGYYILPLLPCLALITGKVIADWTSGQRPGKPTGPFTSPSTSLRVAASASAGLMALVGIALLYACHAFGLPWYMYPAAVAGVAAALVSLRHFISGKVRAGFLILFVLMLVCQAWIFNQGAGIAEQKRTLRSFARQATVFIKGVDREKVTLYRQGTASLIFYLNAGFRISNCDTVEDLEKFGQKHPGGILIVDLNDTGSPQEAEYLARMEALFTQSTGPNEREEHFAVLRFKPAKKTE